MSAKHVVVWETMAEEYAKAACLWTTMLGVEVSSEAVKECLLLAAIAGIIDHEVCFAHGQGATGGISV